MRWATWCFLSLALAVGPAAGQEFDGWVVEVKDGDTIAVWRDGTVSLVELHGLDAPELEQPYGDEAARFLRVRLRGDIVDVRVRDRDRHGRLVATVMHDGAEVNAQVLRAGLAWYYWWYDEYTPDAEQDQALEYRAQQAGRGLWAQAAPTPPWNWRDEGRHVAYDRRGPTDLQYNPAGRPRECEAFETQQEAQNFLEVALPSTAQPLDEDGDGVACEQLPAE